MGLIVGNIRNILEEKINNESASLFAFFTRYFVCETVFRSDSCCYPLLSSACKICPFTIHSTSGRETCLK